MSERKVVMKTILALCAAVFASLEVFAATSVVYDSSDPQTSYADGAVSVSYDDGGAITAISADPVAADGIEFSGDAMTLSPTASAITLGSTGTVTFANSLTAAGASASSPATISFAATAGATDGSPVVLEGKVGTDDRLVSSDMLLYAVTNMTAKFDKEFGKTTGYVPCDTVPCFFEVKGNSATVQFQKRTGTATLRAVTVVLTQTRAGIYAKTTGYAHFSISQTNLVEGDVFITKKNYSLLPGSTWKDGYYDACFVTNLTLHALGDRPLRSSVVLSAANDISNAAVTIGGDTHPVRLNIADREAFPKSGSVEVATNGCLWLSVGAVSTKPLSGIENGVPITVKKGGVLVTDAISVFDATSSSLTLDGGTLNIAPYAASTSEQTVYLSTMVLRDGALITGPFVRTRKNNLVWTVEGSSPSVCDVGLRVWTVVAESQSGYKKSRFEMNVSDVTGDAEADFICRKPIMPAVTTAAGYTGACLAKAGAGTLRIDAHFAMTNTPTRIEAGTFLVNGDCLNDSDTCPFVLAGGTFAVAAGSTNYCGVLNIESASTLSVPSGALLSFADSSGSSWTTGVDVVVDADLTADSVRFGTNASGLTASQARRLKNGGRPCYLDENGYLRQKPITGLMLIFK